MDLRYFDLNRTGLKSKSSEGINQDPDALYLGKPARMSVIKQMAMYSGVLVGVLFSSIVDEYRRGKTVSLSFSLGTLVVSAIISLMILPITYRKLRVRLDAPFVVQFGLFVQSGVFWHIVLGTIGRTVAK